MQELVGWLVVPEFAPSFEMIHSLLLVGDDIKTYQIALGM